MTEKLLLELIVLLLGCVLGLMGLLYRKHDRLHDSLDEKIDSLSQMRVSCGTAFATKDSVTRAHERLDEQQAELGELSTRVARLEGQTGGRP